MVKRIIFSILIFALFSVEGRAENLVKFIAVFESEFSPVNMSEFANFIVPRDVKIGDLVIPRKSLVTMKIFHSQRELRWHKAGFMLVKPVLCTNEEHSESVDVSSHDVYFLIKKYDKIDKKDFALTGSEIAATTAASFFIPGIDIAYYFTKGVIKGDKHENRFKSGVYTAYDNSIFWFVQKGKPINLKDGDEVLVLQIPEEDFNDKSERVKKRNNNEYVKSELKSAKNDYNSARAKIDRLKDEYRKMSE